MKVLELSNQIFAKVVTKENTKQNDCEGVYVGDLLSNVMANIQEGNIFVTIMCNMNTVAVASLKDVPVIVFCENKQPTKQMIEKADECDIAILVTTYSAVDVIRKIYQI